MADVIKVKNKSASAIDFTPMMCMIEDSELGVGETKVVYAEHNAIWCPLFLDEIADGNMVLVVNDDEKTKEDSLSIMSPSKMLVTAKL